MDARGPVVPPVREDALSAPDYRTDVAAFTRDVLRVEVLPWQSAVLTRLTGELLVERIMVRRVSACMAAGLHSFGGCRACGVAPKKS